MSIFFHYNFMLVTYHTLWWNSEFLRRAVFCLYAKVSEEDTASTFRAELKIKRNGTSHENQAPTNTISA
jgi:hypothetical protein